MISLNFTVWKSIVSATLQISLFIEEPQSPVRGLWSPWLWLIHALKWQMVLVSCNKVTSQDEEPLENGNARNLHWIHIKEDECGFLKKNMFHYCKLIAQNVWIMGQRLLLNMKWPKIHIKRSPNLFTIFNQFIITHYNHSASRVFFIVFIWILIWWNLGHCGQTQRDDHLRISESPDLHVFGLWVETGDPGRK